MFSFWAHAAERRQQRNKFNPLLTGKIPSLAQISLLAIMATPTEMATGNKKFAFVFYI